jgi:hypothetical protein
MKNDQQVLDTLYQLARIAHNTHDYVEVVMKDGRRLRGKIRRQEASWPPGHSALGWFAIELTGEPVPLHSDGIADIRVLGSAQPVP